MTHRVIPKDHPKYPAIRRRLIETWLKTILGFGMMGGLIALALWAFGFSFSQLGFFGILWLVLPVVMWMFSAKVALFITKSVPADPNDPVHARLLRIIDAAFPKSGLKYKPKVYISPNPLPNAFATGPMHRYAVVAATNGLFNCGMTDEEIEAVFLHEFSHVKNYDVGINSLIAVLSSLFFLISDAGVRAILRGLGWMKSGFGLRKRQEFIPGILTNILMYAIFWLTGQVTRVIQLFVVRSRESGADATASDMGGKPCDLATALLKLVAFVEKNRPKAGRESEMYRGMRVIMTVDPIFDAIGEEPKGNDGIWGALKRFWKKLQLTHPPVAERVRELERMNGGACPRPAFLRRR